MTPQQKIKLNLPCIKCGKIIYITEGTMIGNKPLHFKCFKEQAIQDERERVKKIILSWRKKELGRNYDTKVKRLLSQIDGENHGQGKKGKDEAEMKTCLETRSDGLGVHCCIKGSFLNGLNFL